MSAFDGLYIRRDGVVIRTDANEDNLFYYEQGDVNFHKGHKNPYEDNLRVRRFENAITGVQLADTKLIQPDSLRSLNAVVPEEFKEP